MYITQHRLMQAPNAHKTPSPMPASSITGTICYTHNKQTLFTGLNVHGELDM